MGRRVITTKDVSTLREAAAPIVMDDDKSRGSTITHLLTLGAAGAPPEVDDYKSRLLKYIPAEIVAAFVTIEGIIKSVTQAPVFVYWTVFFVLLVLTPFYVWRVSSEPDKPPATAQIVVAAIAFFVWVFALGGPFSSLGWYMPLYGSILLVLYTVAIPAFVGK